VEGSTGFQRPPADEVVVPTRYAGVHAAARRLYEQLMDA
jgi:hypothetical protein